MNQSSTSSRKELLYCRGDYLAVRAGSNGFYLCHAQQHIYTTTERFKIMWLSEVTQQPGTYIVDYLDYTEFQCIITRVRLKKVAWKTYMLPENQREKIKRELQQLLNPEESEEEEDSDDEEPQAKKARKAPTVKIKKAPAKSRLKPQAKAKQNRQRAVATKAKKPATIKEPKPKKKVVKEPSPEKPKKRRLTPEERANPNLLLVANPNVTVWEKNPLTDSNEKVPYVSPSAHSKLVFRAVAMNDMKLLQSLIDNTKNIDKVDYQYSVLDTQTPLHRALKAQNIKAIQLLTKEIFDRDAKKPARCYPSRNLLKTAGTGRYDRRSLYIPAVRTLSMSRGSKEGNNALTKDESAPFTNEGLSSYIKHALSSGVSKKIIDFLMISSNNANNHYIINEAYAHGIRNGHRKLVAALLEEQEKRGDNSYNVLAREVMQFDTEELRKSSLREASIKKKSWDNAHITPLHCAAINPNTRYLQKLCSIFPEYGIPDRNNRRPIHYAAACEGTGPLEYLMSRGVNPDEPDSSGTTPLMIACETGRVDNVDFLLRQAKAKSEMPREEDEDACDDENGSLSSPVISSYGIGGINRPIQRPNQFQSYCPIHLAVTKNQLEVVKRLIKYGVDVNKKLSAGKNKVTPLMIACGMGNMAIVKALIKEKARVEEKDKLHRTPLIHAVMNGQAHVVSYLLSLGANADQADSSGNTCLHYAAAYGWYFCIKTLLEAGADPAKPNDWQLAPLGIAFLKGHVGIVDQLLQQPGININFQDDQGKTLVALACSLELIDGAADEIEYLVNKKGADVTIADVNNNTPLHHLAQNEIINPNGVPIEIGYLEQCIQIAKILLGHGAKGSKENEEGVTPVMCAIEKGNVQLAYLLIDKEGEFFIATNKNEQNALHLMAQKCMSSDFTPLLEMIQGFQKRKTVGDILHKMARAVDKHGYTPLLYACKSYRDWKGGMTTSDENNSFNNNDEDEESEHDSNDDDDDEESEHDSNDDDDDDDDNDNDSDYDSNSGGHKRKARRPSNRPAKAPKKSASLSEDEVDQSWECGRKFILSLLDLCGADQNAVVQEKKYSSTDEIPKKEADKYVNPNEAKYTPWHFLVAASHEAPVRNRKGEVEDFSPVLSLFFRRCKASDLDKYNLCGRTPLIMALEGATERSHDCAKKLIKCGANLNLRSKVKSDCGSTPLCAAISNGCPLDVIQALLKTGINMSCTKHKNTPLHLAVSKNRGREDILKVVERLIEAGAHVNAVNYKGRTPLHLAVNANSGGSDATSELESYLIGNGASPLAKDHRDRLPIHYTFTKIGKYHDVSHIDPIELCATLAGMTSSRVIDEADKRGQTLLHLAARRGAGVCCTVLVQNQCNVNSKDKTGNTPLTWAAVIGHENCAIMLIQKNAAVNVTAVVLPQPKPRSKGEKSKGHQSDDEEEENEDLVSDSEGEEEERKPNLWVCKVHRKKRPEPLRVPLFQVCVKNNWAGVIYMMLDVMDEAKLTAMSTIEAALNTGQYNLALTLIRRFKDNRNFRETNPTTGRNLFHTLAAKVRPDVHQDLLLRVANELHRTVPLDNKDHCGCKPLHYAALRHSVPLIKFILEHVRGLDVNESDRFGRTPLAAAFWMLKTETLPVYEELYNMGTNLNDQYSFPELIMHFGKVPEDTHSAEEVEAEYMTEQKSVRCTPLIRAIQMQKFEVVKHLLKDGADVNARDSLQRVPLVHAIRRNNIHLVKLLLNHSYNVPGTDVTEVKWITFNDDSESSGGSKWPHAPRRPVFSLLRPHKVADSDEEDGGNRDGEENNEVEQVAKKAKSPGSKKDALNDINLSNYKMFRNVSGVKLTLVDQQGWSLIHHIVAPIEEATFDNVEMLKLLSDAGTPLAEKDKTGLTPLDYALRYNAPNLAKALQKLMGVKKGQWENPTMQVQPPVSDGLVWTTPKPNFNADSAALVSKFEEEWMEEEQPDTRPSPDKELEMGESGEVEMDTDQDVAFDVVLTKVDVQGNFGWGLFNFYIMQVVKHKAKNLWILFNRWGYIGRTGQFQRTPFGKREDAVKEFCKIFRAKTGNDWKNIKSFEAQLKKYRLVDPEDRQKRKNLRDIKLNLKSTVSCSLPDSLHDLMKELMDPHMLQSAYNESAMGSSMIPFSRMRKETIAKAVELLNTLRPVVEELEVMKSKDLHTDDNIEKYIEKFSEVVSLSNQLHQLLPDRGHAFQDITVLMSKYEIEDYLDRLVNLAELELASRMLTGAMYRRQEINPAEYVYRSIGATIRAMNPDEIEVQYLLKYISTGMNTSGNDKWNASVEAIFEVNRAGEQHRINSLHLDNHKLLFHGTNTSNLIGILHRGLLIAPPGVMISGHLHGKGMYFADMFCKSANYTQHWNDRSKSKYMLICQVALGNAQVRQYQENLGAFDSRFVPGKHAPRSDMDVRLRDGCILPLGDVIEYKAKNWYPSEYSEYIVFNSDQVRIRYLIKFS